MDSSIREALTPTPPPVLYKYLDPEGAAKTLAARTFKFSPFDQLDDIREALPGKLENGTPEEEHEVLRQTLLEDSGSRSFYNKQFGTSFTEEQWIHGLELDTIDIDIMVKSGMTKTPESTLLEFQQSMSKDCAICSFSDASDIELMWALYAKHHRGICLGFTIPKQFELQQVDYSDNAPSLPFAVGHRDLETYRKMLRVFRTKRRCWSFQQEWRVMVGQSRLRNSNGLLLAPFSSSSLVEIILGARFSTDATAFNRFFRRQFPRAQVSQASICPTEPKLTIRPVLPPITDNYPSNDSDRICTQFSNLEELFKRHGLTTQQIADMLDRQTRLLEQRMCESPLGRRLVKMRHHSNEHSLTIRCASAQIAAYAQVGAHFFVSPEKNGMQCYESIVELFTNQKQEEVVSSLPENLALASDRDLASRFLSHVLLLTFYA